MHTFLVLGLIIDFSAMFFDIPLLSRDDNEASTPVVFK